ncbi:MAG: maltose alpha-D-glucosyltransferase [Gammaproteobacteria bacterium]|nr:maltose alpha-D-glucosyltransferase [Gammaproteobacteria bacterium]MBI5616643.1 maltose alpha-D-glucosyltransferase [Gammaproteobacteria bacterium]
MNTPVSLHPDRHRASATPASQLRPPLWFKDIVIYEVHVRAFFDSNGDGIGDFPGLTSKLDYIRDLGVDAIWVLPFYPSPGRDDGYDIADYHDVHEQYGSLHDFRTFVREAHRRGLRVITELVINHTSDQHAWFQAARRAPPGSKKRDYYVWSDDPARYAGTRIIFTDTETSNWTWDAVAGAYYWHRFFSHQPDLNFDNPSVLKAVTRAMRYWLDMGVDGLRLDAVPYLCEREGTNNENLPETHAVIRRIREVLDEHYGDRMLLAEANQWPEDVRDYFADGEECHMAFHFPLMPRIYMAIAQEERHPIVEIMEQTPDIPDACQWAIFLRNHDELTLEMVTSRERDYMYRMYAAEPRARLNLGIRRRLAPLLDNDVGKIQLVNSLLLSMPGSPIIYYGDEIGMGDNMFLGDRNGVRTPMQWSPDRNAGFSRADPQRLYFPPIMDPVYGYEAVNVEAQARDPSSLLNWMRRLLAVRRTTQAFGRGTLRFLNPGNRKILAYVREYGHDVILCVANMARSAHPVELDLSAWKGLVPVEMLGRTSFPPIGDVPYLLTLAGHGFYWFSLTRDAAPPDWHADRGAPEDLPVLVLFDGWNTFFRDRVVPWRIGMAERVRSHLEAGALPRFLGRQRWFAGKGLRIPAATLSLAVEFTHGNAPALLCLLDIAGAEEPTRYFAPMTLAWEEEEDRMRLLQPAAIARVRQQANVGLLADAFADPDFCHGLVAEMAAGREIASFGTTLRFSSTPAFGARDPAAVRTLAIRSRALSSNTTVQLGDRFFLKGFRRLRTGVNPELEIGLYLTNVVGYAHAVPVAGALELVAADGGVCTLAVLYGYIDNQGDGWEYTSEYLARFLETHAEAAQPPGPEVHGIYLTTIHTLGVRTGGLHLALAQRTGDPAFDPVPVDAADLRAWRSRVVAEATATLARLRRELPRLAADAQGPAEAVLARDAALIAGLQTVPLAAPDLVKTRYHGDYHLGQVLLSNNDIIITDFEGEPGRDLAERRARHSALRDVAGMLRSLHYAGISALRQASARGVVRDEETERLQSLLQDWERATRETFLSAYAGATAGPGRLYADFADVSGLLALFEAEKACYELRYELDNRPAWAAIPLQGILRCLAALDATGPRGSKT